MAISIISQAHVAGTEHVNSFSSSVTANAGDASLNLQGAYSAYLGTHGAEVSI